MNELLLTINGFDLLIAMIAISVGYIAGSRNQKKINTHKNNIFLRWLEGESIEQQMMADGWNLPDELSKKRKAKKRA